VGSTHEDDLRAGLLLAAGYRALESELGDGPFGWESAVTAVGNGTETDEDEARWIVTCLDALQVFDHEGAQLRLEPILRQCMALRD
jgi:hypothetical protein